MESQNSSDDLLENIAKLQKDYYSKNQKNMFFKKSQKNDCANMISSQMDIQLLFQNTLFVLPHKKIIFFDYTVFKTYMFPELFESFLDYAFQLTHGWIQDIDQYELYVNINTFSVSALERYRKLIELVFQRYPPSSVETMKMSKMRVFYTPHMIEQIMQIMSPFISHMRDRMVFYSKSESADILNQLQQGV